MQPRSRAVIIGVNADDPPVSGVAPLQHAVDDAQALFEVLTDPVIGTFDRVDVTLLVGRDAATRPVKAALRQAASECRRGDTLLIYFAGHGMLDPLNPQGDPYLVTADLRVDELALDPDAGLRMSFLQRDVFGLSDASGVLLLDCCHAGASIDGGARSGSSTGAATSGEHSLLSTVVALLRDPSRNTHEALVACPRNAAARESDAIGHGVFTAALLEGLRGGAGEVVTLELLSNYVNLQQLDQQPGRHLFGFGTSALLTRPGVRNGAVPASGAAAMAGGDVTPASGRFPLVSGPSTPGIAPPFAPPATDGMALPLPNPLDGRSHHLLRTIDALFDQRVATTAGAMPTALATLQRVFEAEAALLARVSPHGQRLLAVAEGAAGVGELLSGSQAVQALLHTARLDRRGALGYAAAEEPTAARARGGDDRCSLVVPLSNDSSTEFDALVLHRLPSTFAFDLGEVTASMVAAFIGSCDETHPALAELAVLNHLRVRYGRLPADVYDRAFELFQQLLDGVRMVFEPMVKLARQARNVRVIGWEALARLGPTDAGAPTALFDAASIWGDRFVIELDSVLADRAIAQYVQAWSDAGMRNGLDPLSVNVSPRSIWSDAYVRQLTASMERHGLDEDGLTLELSEKDPITVIGEDLRFDGSPAVVDAFNRRLEALREEHSINFAIDDFGVGHASLDRLATLKGSHVKIDRAVLHHRDADLELRLVLDVAKRRRLHDQVIVEGVDEHCPLSLHQLWQLGVRRIQGHITERGSARVDYLQPETTERLAALVRGEDA